MIKKYLLGAVLPTLILLVACPENDPLAVNYTAPGLEKCLNDSLNTYHFILPEGAKEKLPLLVVLDPHGNGLLAVNVCRKAVSRFPCIVVGSDRVRNNLQGYESIIRQVVEDASQKFPVDPRLVYIAGFSGGARMAYAYALHHPVKGVLMCGAGPSGNSSQTLPFRLYMISGTTDFNFAEQYYNPLKKTPELNYFTDFFRGKHEWPSPSLIEDGLLYLMAEEIQGGTQILRNKAASLENMADSLENTGNHFFAIKSIEKAILFDPDNKALHKRLKAFEKSAGSGLAGLENNLAMENKAFRAYSEAILRHDSLWWFNEIRQLDRKINNTEGEEQDHLLRIRAFLGVMFYSMANRMIRSHEGEIVPHLLAAYRCLEPENPDVYYFYALFSLLSGNKADARAYLEKSLSMGFNDPVWMSDFPPGITETMDQ